MAVNTVAASTVTKAFLRALSARMYWFRSMAGSLGLENRFADENHVVGAHGLGGVGVVLEHLALAVRAAQLDAPLAAARRDAAAERDGLHHVHALGHRVGAGARHLAVDVEHGGAVDVDRVAALQLELLGERVHLLRL